jgi:putative heme transporter
LIAVKGSSTTGYSCLSDSSLAEESVNGHSRVYRPGAGGRLAWWHADPRPAGALVTALAAADEARHSVLGGRPRSWRQGLRTGTAAVLVVATFWFAIPHFASYRSVWASMAAMTMPYALLIAATAAASMVSCWVMICAVLPSLRLREAAVVNLGSTAVANTLPAGGALALGVSWVMLSSWDIDAGEYLLYTLVSGIWNVFARLGLPVLALLFMLTDGRPDGILLSSAAAGLVLLAALLAGLGLILRSESLALRAQRVLDRVRALAARLLRRPRPCAAAAFLPGLRNRAAALLAARGWWITATTAASQFSLWLVLLACLRGVGLSQGQVSWQASLAAFAFVRLLTALPITPGGIGVVELGLVGILAAGADHRIGAEVTAAVLLYRAVTFLPTIPLGAAAYLLWRHAPGFTGAGRRLTVPDVVPGIPKRTGRPGEYSTLNG